MLKPGVLDPLSDRVLRSIASSSTPSALTLAGLRYMPRQSKGDAYRRTFPTISIANDPSPNRYQEVSVQVSVW